MSSLTLIEIRIPTRDDDPGLLLTAEWVKAPAGMKQYRATSRRDAMCAPRADRYYDTAELAVADVLRAAKRAHESIWKNA